MLSKSDCGLIDEIDIEGAICRFGQHKTISEIDDEVNKCSDDTIFLLYMSDSNDQQVNTDDLIDVNWEDNNHISVHYDKRLESIERHGVYKTINIKYGKH